MNDKNYKCRQQSQKRPEPLLFAGAVLLLGIMILASPLRPSSQARTDHPSESREIQEDTALPATPQKGPDDWRLLLVNRRNPLPEGYAIRTVELRNGFQVDERCYPDLQAMMDACRMEGLSPVICSAYRTWEY